MNELVISLKQKLDEIDNRMYLGAMNRLTNAGYKIKIGMWEKGEAISGVFRGVKTPPSWRELEKQTDRNHEALKNWYELYLANPNKKEYEKRAKEEAIKWAKSRLPKMLGEPKKKIAEEYPVVPEGKYSTIVADPPWPVESIILDKWESPIEDKYKTMTIEEIKQYFNHNWKADSCNLFLWTIHSFLREALEVMDAWEFKYFCCITWDKKGGWSTNGFHKRTELCLYGYHNKININQTGEFIPTIIEELKREHSRKPKIFDDILRKNTPEPRLELFPREAKDGFKCPGYN